MSIFSSYKKIFLLGFILTILIAIPFSVYVAQKRQQTTTKAAAATVLSLEPALATVKQGEILTLNIVLDPGSGTSANQVSFVKLSINYDSSKFTAISNSLTSNPEPSNTLRVIVDDAKIDSGKASISLSIGSEPTNAVTSRTKIAILQLKATDTVTPTDPNFTFDSANTQVLSIASSDQTSENVLSLTIPAKVAVTSTASPTLTLTPTSIPGNRTSVPGLTITPSLPPSSAICSSLEVNGLTTGVTPYSLTFTATGSNPTGTISKISFNFGDSVEDLITGGGIGTSSVSGQLIHTYKTPGIYTAYAILTDNNDSLSIQQPNCTQTIMISSAELSMSPTPQPIPCTDPACGDGKTTLGLGVLGVIITIIGGALLLL